MKILYRQASKSPIFEQIGVKNCCFKLIDLKGDRARITHKEHYHTCFEFHVILSGEQSYRVGEDIYHLKKGDILFFPTTVRHCAMPSDCDTLKFSALLELTPDSLFGSMDRIVQREADEGFFCSLNVLREIYATHGGIGMLYEAHAMSLLLWLLRPFYPHKDLRAAVTAEQNTGDWRVAMARQYIADNIELHPTINEVAAYCYLGTKQLTRLFQCAEGMTLNAYIREQKLAHMRKLLMESDLSLGEISERMHFSSEYYFNTYFKSHAGMTPGEYRKMMKEP